MNMITFESRWSGIGAPKVYANVLRWAPSSVTRRGAPPATAAVAAAAAASTVSLFSGPASLDPWPLAFPPRSEFPPGCKTLPAHPLVWRGYPHQSVWSRGRQHAVFFSSSSSSSSTSSSLTHKIILFADQRFVYSRTVQRTTFSFVQVSLFFLTFFWFTRVLPSVYWRPSLRWFNRVVPHRRIK